VVIGYPLVGACGYGALYWAANSGIYYPSRYPKGRWETQAQVGAADVWLRSRDGCGCTAGGSIRPARG